MVGAISKKTLDRYKTTVTIDSDLRDRVKAKIIGTSLSIEKAVEMALTVWLRK